MQLIYTKNYIGQGLFGFDIFIKVTEDIMHNINYFEERCRLCHASSNLKQLNNLGENF